MAGSRLAAVLRRVEEGEGRLAGARGLNVSVVVLGEGKEVTDHQVGVLVLP